VYDQNYRHPKLQLVKDPRTIKNEEGMPIVQVLGVSFCGKQCYIVCPYCGEIHMHGNMDGHRVSHCSIDAGGDDGYVIRGADAN
jgi:uncharacterized radical SAM superfamily protein